MAGLCLCVSVLHTPRGMQLVSEDLQVSLVVLLLYVVVVIFGVDALVVVVVVCR